LLARIHRFLINCYLWHTVLNCAFASFLVGMSAVVLVPRRFDPQRRIPHRVGTFFWGTLVWALTPYWKLEVEGEERLREGGPYLLCANHQSLLDVLVVMALGSDFKWVSGLRFFKIPLFSSYMRATGYISADLANPFAGAAVLDECGQWLESGVSVGIFPEGTRSRDGRLGSFKPGAFRVALTHGVRVLPLVIDGSREALPRGSWTWLGESPYKSIRIKVLEPIDPAELANIEAVSLAKSCQAAVADTLAQWRDAEIEEQVWVRARAADGAVETRARADA
jgi:1-acyl-sn-glycerol-3-phosphate acyltransferase